MPHAEAVTDLLPVLTDPGAKMMSAIASIIDEKEPEEINRVIEDIADPAGFFYRFSLPVLINKKKSIMKKITIDPITRLEGHGKIEIFLNDEGEVGNVYFQVPELRGFEKFCEGRPVEELPAITAKICGVCPGCHHMASGKAVDAVFGVEPPPTAKKLRELFYMAHFVHSHTAHFYALAAPDFVVGPYCTAFKEKYPRSD